MTMLKKNKSRPRDSQILLRFFLTSFIASIIKPDITKNMQLLNNLGVSPEKKPKNVNKNLTSKLVSRFRHQKRFT